MTRSARVTIALLGTAAVLAGCGGEPAAVTDKDAVLHLKLDEYTIAPQVIRVVATSNPMPVKIVARNIGRLTHNVRVVAQQDGAATPDDTVLLAAGSKPLGGTPTAQPGQVVRTETPVLLRPGRYRLTDSVGNHDGLGQYGTLIVVAGPGSGGPATP